MKKKGSLILMVVLVIALIVGYIFVNKKLEADPNTKNISVVVVFENGAESKHDIKTNALNLEDALTGCDFVKGEDGPYGLYITEVEEVYAKYEVNGAYWAMYKGEEMLQTGAKDTILADGDVYKLVYSKM